MRKVLFLAIALYVGCGYWGCFAAPPRHESTQERALEKTAHENLPIDIYDAGYTSFESSTEPSKEPNMDVRDVEGSKEELSSEPESSSIDAGEPVPEEPFIEENFTDWDPPCTPQSPPAVELCNGIDDDCDGIVDESCQHLQCTHVDTFPVKNTENHHTDILRVRFDPKGRYFYTSAGFRYPSNARPYRFRHVGYGEIKVWDVKTGKLLKTFDSPIFPLDIVPSFDGKTLYSTNFHHHMLAWDVDTGRLQAVSVKGKDYDYERSFGIHLSLESNGATLAKLGAVHKGIEDGVLQLALWSPNKSYQTIPLDTIPLVGYVYGWVHLSKDAKKAYIYYRERNRTTTSRFYPVGAKILDLTTKKKESLPVLPQAAKGHSIMMEHMFPSRDGKSLIVIYADTVFDIGHTLVSWESYVAVYDVGTKTLLRTWKAHDTPLNRFAQTPDGAYLLTAFESDIRIWEPTTGKQVGALNIAPDKIGVIENEAAGLSAVDISPDGKQVLVTLGAKITLWDVATKKKIYSINKGTAPKENIKSHSLTSDGAMLAVLDEKRVSLWTLQPRKHVKDIPAAGALEVKFQEHGTLLAILKQDEVDIWDVKQDKKLYTWGLKDLKEAHFHPNKKEFVAISSSLKGISIWSLTSGQLLRTTHSDKDMLVSVSHDLKTGIWDERSFVRKVIDLPSGKVLRELSFFRGGSVFLSSKGKFLDVFSWGPCCDYTAGLYTRRYKPLLEFKGSDLGPENIFPSYLSYVSSIGLFSKRLFINWNNIGQLRTIKNPSSVIDWILGMRTPVSISYKADVLTTTSLKSFVKTWRCLPSQRP